MGRNGCPRVPIAYIQLSKQAVRRYTIATHVLLTTPTNFIAYLCSKSFRRDRSMGLLESFHELHHTLVALRAEWARPCRGHGEKATCNKHEVGVGFHSGSFLLILFGLGIRLAEIGAPRSRQLDLAVEPVVDLLPGFVRKLPVALHVYIRGDSWRLELTTVHLCTHRNAHQQLGKSQHDKDCRIMCTCACCPYHCHVRRRREIQDGILGSLSIGIGVRHHFARSVTVIFDDVHVIQQRVLHQVEIG